MATASASAAEPFSIRGFVARMRSVDAAKCHPFGAGGCMDGENEPPPPPPLPPMEPPPRSRWWAHELAAARARLSACAGGGGPLRKGAKRKGSRPGAAAERAKKRRRVLQFRALLKNKGKTSKPQSTYRLHQHMLHMGLLRKQKGSLHSWRELTLRKKSEEAQDQLPPHENSLTHKMMQRMGPSGDMQCGLSRGNEADSFVNEQSIKVSVSTNYPVNTSGEVVRHAAGAKDDIFGDLPLLESSKVIFQTGGDELPTVIEESFITDQSEPDAEPEIVSLKLINAYGITTETSPLDDVVEIEETSDKEPNCINYSDAARSYALSAGVDCLPKHKNYASTARSSYPDLRSKCASNNPPRGCFDMNTNCSQGIKKHDTSSAASVPVVRTRTDSTNSEDARVIVKKSTDVSALVAASSNHISDQDNVLPYAVSQGVIDSRTTKNHLPFQGSVHARAYETEMTLCRTMPASTSSISPLAIRTGTEPSNYKDVPVIFKKSNDISGSLITSKNHFSYQGSELQSAVSQGIVSTRITNNHLSAKSIVLPSAVSQRVGSMRTNADEMTSHRNMPSKERIPASRSAVNITNNICVNIREPMDACAALSTEKKDSWCSKVQPICSPASIGSAFMKLPGLERMEISSCKVKTGENSKFMNEQSLNTARHQKQQLVNRMPNVMQGQKNVGLSQSQAGKIVLDGDVGQNVPHPQQPTMRLMGKTVSICKRSKDHSASNMGKVCSDNITTEATPLTAIPCHFPQKRSFPYQDFVIPRAHLNESLDMVARIPSNTLSGKRTTFNGIHNQRLPPINNVSSTIKDCRWNFGSEFACQGEHDKVPMVCPESSHVKPHQPSHMTSIPQNQQSQYGTVASCRSGDDHYSVGPARNQSSSIPQGLLKSSMKEKYQKSTLLRYDDPSSAPISQPYHIPGTKLPSASIISFFDYGSNNSLSRYPSSGSCPSRTTSLANVSVSASGLTPMGTPTNADGSMGVCFANQINTRSACADNISQQPAKRQLVTDRHHVTSMGSNMTNHSFGWSLDDAVGPQILDFCSKGVGDAAQIWKK